MTVISFSDAARCAFACRFLDGAGAAQFNAVCRPAECEIEIAHPVVARLLGRLAADRGTVLPFVGRGDEDAWMILAPARRDLEQTLGQTQRFVVPTYADFGGGPPVLKGFNPSGKGIQRDGAALFPLGYYCWRSPASFRGAILARLGLWLSLEEQRPVAQVRHVPAYRPLHDMLQAALGVGDWPAAEECLRELAQYNLTTADNLAFLEVQLLAQRNRWEALWLRQDYETLARLRVPRAVRAALLTAFHHSKLLPLEQEARWTEALAVFGRERPRLGLLLTGRFGLAAPAVLQVYAYEAAHSRDRDALLSLCEDASSVPEAAACIEALLALLPPPTQLQALTPGQRAVLALRDQDYDTALALVPEIGDPVEACRVLLEIAFFSGDSATAEHAQLAFWDLPAVTQQELRAQRQIAMYLSAVEKALQADAPPPIADWLEWLSRAVAEPNDPALSSVAAYLQQTVPLDTWGAGHAGRLATLLQEFILDKRASTASYARTVVRHFISAFLRDTHFPREDEAYAELYEALYVGLFDFCDVNTTWSLALLRLADAKLRRKPSDRHVVGSDLRDWFRTPIPNLESWVLEAFDLLMEAGLPGGALSAFYREWLQFLLDLPVSRDRTSLEAWQIYGQWVQPGKDLLALLDSKLQTAVAADVDDPVAALPADFQIGIFTLRPGSAERVRAALLARNASLDIRICTDDVLSGTARSLAENSDMAVVVTTAMSHSLTYGIGPYLRHEPVYPPSSGSTSILRAIEGAAANTHRSA